MAITLTNVQKPTQGPGHHWRTVYTVACDNSYPTGGYTIKNTDLGFASTVDPEFRVLVFDTYGYGVRYDYVNQKLIFYTTAGTQTSNATDLSALTLVRIEAIGKFRG